MTYNHYFLAISSLLAIKKGLINKVEFIMQHFQTLFFYGIQELIQYLNSILTQAEICGLELGDLPDEP